MSIFLVNCSGVANITFYIVKAENEIEAERILTERLGYKSTGRQFQDITNIEFLNVIDCDDASYEG